MTIKELNEKMEKLNKGVQNGWSLDAQMFVYYKEKDLTKRIKTGEGKGLRAKCYYKKVYENFRKIGYKITINVNSYSEDKVSGFEVSSGFGRDIFESEEIYQKKEYKKLVEKVKEFDDNKIIELYNKAQNVKITGFINNAI